MKQLKKQSTPKGKENLRPAFHQPAGFSQEPTNQLVDHSLAAAGSVNWSPIANNQALNDSIHACNIPLPGVAPPRYVGGAGGRHRASSAVPIRAPAPHSHPIALLPYEIGGGQQATMASSHAMVLRQHGTVYPDGFATVGQPRQGEVPTQFTEGLIMEASGNSLPYLPCGVAVGGEPSELSGHRAARQDEKKVVNPGAEQDGVNCRPSMAQAASTAFAGDPTTPKPKAGRSHIVDRGAECSPKLRATLSDLAYVPAPITPKSSGAARTRSYTKDQHDFRRFGITSEKPLDAPLESKEIEGHPEVKVRDFAYAASSKDNTTNWAKFSVDAAVAIVNALKEAKQMGQLTKELQNLLEVGELAIVNLPKLLSLHKSELELEVDKTFTAFPDGNPALHVQLASLLMASYVAGGEKLEQSLSGAAVGSQSSPLSMTQSGGRRGSLHRRSPAGSGFHSLFPGSPSPRAIAPHAAALALASHDGPVGSIFPSANRKLHFAPGEGKRKETALTAASKSKVTQSLAPDGEPSVAVGTANQPSQVGDASLEGSTNDSGVPVAEVQPTTCVSGSLTNEEIVRALLKRASLQAKTGVRSALTGREAEEDRLFYQRPPSTPTNTPIIARSRSVPANQNITPTIEELQNAMARAVLLAKQKGIPPPDWEQLMKQEDYVIKHDIKMAANPELHRLTRIQEEDGIDLEETSSPEGEATPSLEDETTSSPDRSTISTQPMEIGDDSNPLVANETEGQGGLTQVAATHEENIAGTMEYVRKQEITSGPTDTDLFQCLDAWLVSREQASSTAAETGEPKEKEPAKEEIDFDAFGLKKECPADTQGASESEKLDPNNRTNRAESEEIGHIKPLSIRREKLGHAEGSRSAEAGMGPRPAIQAPEGFEPLLPNPYADTWSTGHSSSRSVVDHHHGSRGW